jgi:hypothetical protein
MFILAVNFKVIISHRGREYGGYKNVLIIHDSDGNDGYKRFPGNDDILPFSKMIEFSVTTDYSDDLYFF